VTDGKVLAVAQLGKTLYLGGKFHYIGLLTGGFAVLDRASGAYEPGVPVVNGVVNAIAADGTGGWFIAGAFTAVGGQARNNLAHIRSDKTLDPTWNANLDGYAYYQVTTLAVSGSVLYVGGYFTTVGGQFRNNIAALDAITGQPTGWNPNSGGTVRALAVSDGVVHVGGGFTSIGGQPRSYIAALDASTGLATAWNPVATNRVMTLAVRGKTVYAGGEFSDIGGQFRNHIAALDASTGLASAWNPSAGGKVSALDANGPVLAIGGAFGSIGDAPRSGVAIFPFVPPPYLPLIVR
jgi:hypothetical protein